MWNKADRIDPELAETLVRTRGGVAISAASGHGLEALLHKADRTLFAEGASGTLGALVTPLPRPTMDEGTEAPLRLPAATAVGG